MTEEKKKMDGAYSQQDDGLNAQIAELQGKIKTYRLLSGAVIALGILICMTGVTVLGMIVVIAGFCIMVVRGSYESKLKKLVADNIIKQALEQVFDNITYEVKDHLPDHYIRSSGFPLPSFDRIEGSDYVQATYQGLQIEMSDMTLVAEDVTTDEDGNQQTSDRIVFQGLWLVCDFGKELSADMRLWERSKLGKRFGGRGIKTENEQFNKHFYIDTEIEHEAFYILTPHMMEYILEMDRKAGGATYLCFARSGKVQIAIQSGRDAFEVKRSETDAAQLRAKFVQEIRYVTDIIDELRLVDTLYRK